MSRRRRSRIEDDDEDEIEVEVDAQQPKIKSRSSSSKRIRAEAVNDDRDLEGAVYVEKNGNKRLKYQSTKDYFEGNIDDEYDGQKKKKILKLLKENKSMEVREIVKAAYQAIKERENQDEEKVVGERQINHDEEIEGIAKSMVKPTVGAVMRYILFMNMTKQRCTSEKIKKNAIDPILGTDIKPITRHHIMDLAMKRFRDLLGYDLVSLSHAPLLNVTKEEKKAKSKNQKSSLQRSKTASDSWFLLNMSESDEEKTRLASDREDNHKRGLLMVVLSLLMLTDGKMKEPEIKKLLVSKMGLKDREEKNPLAIKEDSSFEKSIQELLREFEMENYICKKKVKGVHDAKGNQLWEYSFGPKTLLEVGLPNVLKFVHQVSQAHITLEDCNKMLLS